MLSNWLLRTSGCKLVPSQRLRVGATLLHTHLQIGHLWALTLKAAAFSALRVFKKKGC